MIFALLHVLRLVLPPGFAAPPHEHQHRNAEDVVIRQRRQRIDRITLTGILHVDETGATRRDVVSRSQRNRPAFVRGDNMLIARRVVGHIRAEILEQGVRHSSEKIEPVVAQVVEKAPRLDHCRQLPPGMSASTSLIGMHKSSASSARPLSRIVFATRNMLGYALRSRWLA